jgi:hypothetical protein
MPGQVLDELRQFHHFLGEKLTRGESALSPEEALDEWRRLHPEAQAVEDEVAAIQQALVDRANGDQGMRFEEFDRDFWKHRNL